MVERSKFYYLLIASFLLVFVFLNLLSVLFCFLSVGNFIIVASFFLNSSLFYFNEYDNNFPSSVYLINEGSTKALKNLSLTMKVADYIRVT
jgi:hypothetical protein